MDNGMRRVVGNEMLQVVRNEQIAEGIYRMSLQGDLVAAMDEPGQFVHIRCGDGCDPLLRRPISICDVDREALTLTIIYRVTGRGTKRLRELVPGQTVDVLGPLGRGFPCDRRREGERVVLVGGGVGVPPLYYLAKELVARGVKVTSVIGFATASQVILEKELAELGEVYVTTADGSCGIKGVVTDVLKGENPPAGAAGAPALMAAAPGMIGGRKRTEGHTPPCGGGATSSASGERAPAAPHAPSRGQAESWDALYACGPAPMLKALQALYGATSLEAYISLEERMGCGVGACLACVCRPAASDGRPYRKICTDGPVFGLNEVIL
ncbi:hypothetical protein BSNK01_19050 [Bacillaceae bacterium]